MKDGTERHQRHEDKINNELVERIELTTGKARYYYFVGNKKEKQKKIDENTVVVAFDWSKVDPEINNRMTLLRIEKSELNSKLKFLII